jgi:LPPG:FO 2-phospho-L-lactate transferase
VVGVSPIIGGAPVSGPAGRLMQARGLAVSPLGVAAAYAPWLRVLLVDEQDQALAGVLAARGVRAVVTDVLMPDAAREVALARRVLEAA